VTPVEDEQGKATETTPQQRSVFGLIKCFITNVHHCTILVKCKLIAGTIEMHNCSHVVLKIEKEATVATLQIDLSHDITVEFHDAPSGKNPALSTDSNKRMHWGDDKDDRIYHAGVRRLHVQTWRDGYLELQHTADYIDDGALPVGNATAEEVQFVTSVVNEVLSTEQVVRLGSSTGKSARAMTDRELQEEKERRERAAHMAVAMAEDMIQIKDKHGNLVTKVDPPVHAEEDVEEVLSPAMKLVVEECEQNKARGNEAFGAGEYGQAILLYTLVLDKASELTDAKLFPCDVVYSNRAACFLKLGQHEKALDDAETALAINRDNLKALFRKGLSLHAMGRYYEALPVLAEAHKKEPHNKQIKQALQFAEVRVEQDHRRRMEGL
jgi:Flp pilus assembly protein TadD